MAAALGPSRHDRVNGRGVRTPCPLVMRPLVMRPLVMCSLVMCSWAVDPQAEIFSGELSLYDPLGRWIILHKGAVPNAAGTGNKAKTKATRQRRQVERGCD